mgnify:CR=1 FL=1
MVATYTVRQLSLDQYFSPTRGMTIPDPSSLMTMAWRWSILGWIQSDSVFAWVHGAYVVILALLALGLGGRVMGRVLSILAFALHVSFIHANIGAIYGELAVPVFKGLDLQLAVRHDQYSKIGGTTNPKIGFRYQPTQVVMFRGSYNTGFRAPTAQQINLGRVQLATTGTIVDPLKCPNPVGNNDPSCQLSSVPYMAGGNPNLKPEKSRQGSLGVAFSPTQDMTASIDYWQITMKDRIHNLTVNDELKYYSVFADNFERDANGNITLIQAGWINAGSSMTKGLDFTLTHNAKLGDNKLTTVLNATKMISAKEQLIAGTAMNDTGAREAMPVRPLPMVQPRASTPPAPINAAPPA